MAKDWSKVEIFLPRKGDKARLAKECRVNVRTVYEALRGMRNTDTTVLVRKKAIELFNGQYIKDNGQR